MTGDVERLRVGRDLLVEFALAVIAWIDAPSDDSRREQLVHVSRLAGPHTGIPHVFEDFAHRVEQHLHCGSETQ